jgi:DNA-binding MarR family transcriptional regulator
MRTIDSTTTTPVDDETGASVATPSARARTADRRLIDAIVAQVESSMRHLRCAAAERLVRQGISMTHLHVLWQLEEHGELGMSRIADLIGVSMSNATGLIDRMEERGLVERVRLTEDRRVVHVRPTAHGLEVLREIEVLRGDLMETVLSRLDDEQLARVARAIGDIRTVLLAEPQSADAPPASFEHPHAHDHVPQAEHTPASRADGRNHTTR